jgi:hypothetical protein
LGLGSRTRQAEVVGAVHGIWLAASRLPLLFALFLKNFKRAIDLGSLPA